jgi:hypothetical protein
MNMFRLLGTVAIGFFLIGCGEQEKTTENHGKKDAPKPKSVERQETEEGTKTARKTPATPQSASDTKSVDNLLANCERLTQGDGTGSVNITDLREAYKKLAMADPKLALEQFGDPQVFLTIGPALYGAVEIVAAKDPELLVKWLNEGLSKYEDRNQVVPLISISLNQLATVAPDKALAAFRILDIPADKKLAVISGLFRGLGASDPSYAISAASSLDPSLASSALSGAAAGATKSDPKMATVIATSITDAEIREGALNRVFGEWFKTDPRLAKDEMGKLDPKTLEDVLVGGVKDPLSLTSSISKSDPLTLLSLLDGFYPTSSNRALFERSINETVGSQPDRTFSTISKLPEGELKRSLYGQAYGTLSRLDPERALSLFSNEKDPALRASALSPIAASIGSEGIDATLRFLGGLKNDEEKSIAFSSAFNSIIHSDLHSAADYLIDLDKKSVGLSPQEKERGYHVVARLLEAKDPHEAKEWMQKLPAAEQPYAMGGIAVEMAKRDVKGLGEYLNTLEKDQVWAAGVNVVISSVEAGDAEMANKWRKALKDANLDNRP